MTGPRYEYMLLLLPLLGTSGCSAHPAAPAPPPAAMMLGEWAYAADRSEREAPSLDVGLFVIIVIDSVESTRFSGRIALWLVGDLGIPPNRFGPVIGSVTPDRRVTVVIPRLAPAGVLTIEGDGEQGVLVVRQSRLGSDAGPFPSGGRFERQGT